MYKAATERGESLRNPHPHLVLTGVSSLTALGSNRTDAQYAASNFPPKKPRPPIPACLNVESLPWIMLLRRILCQRTLCKDASSTRGHLAMLSAESQISRGVPCHLILPPPSFQAYRSFQLQKDSVRQPIVYHPLGST